VNVATVCCWCRLYADCRLRSLSWKELKNVHPPPKRMPGSFYVAALGGIDFVRSFVCFIRVPKCSPPIGPLAPAICYLHRRLSPHPDTPHPGVMACHI